MNESSRPVVGKGTRPPVRLEEATPLKQAGVGEFDAAASVRDDGSINYFHPEHIKSGAFWAYLIIIVIVAICLFVMISDSNCDGWYDRLNRPWTLSIGGLLFGWVFIFLIILIAAYVGHVEAPNERIRIWLTWMFLLQIIILLIWGFFFYNQRNLIFGLYLSFVAFFLAGWWVYLLWNINRAISLLLVIHLFWIGFLSWSQWQILDKNH